MTINKKLLWGYGVVLALMLIVTTVAISALHRTQSAYDKMVDVNAQIVDQVNAMGRYTREQVTHYRGAIIYTEDRDDYIQRLHDARDRYETNVEKIRELLTNGSERELLGRIESIYAKFETAQNAALSVLANTELGTTLRPNVEVADLSDDLVVVVDQLRRQQEELVKTSRSGLVEDARFLTLLMVLVSAIAIIAGLGIATFIGRGITRQMQESAGLLSASAAEILATTTQLATGATETNTAVSETTATVEEVKQTAELASEKARQVMGSAQKAAEASYSGQQSVETAIAGMHHIQAQMEAIAESIVSLSEQSQSIGEIIIVVSNLAEQSNLLAVNAAIEATRAGEQGKGFAVVAQEVKSLAEQSKQATSQVRAILKDIQKATSSAVLATEQGSKAVAAGVKQSTEAGDVIRVLTEGVSEAAEAATQIAASSHQQMVGMDQVAIAMDSIKQASVQNAAGARQAESAAKSLHDLGRKLIAMVGGRHN
jgi:methyl-accepting chemotaxis protein